MTQMNTFESQQTLAYMQGRKAYNVGRSTESNPYTAGSFKSEGWLNGWRDASQGLAGKGLLVIR